MPSGEDIDAVGRPACGEIDVMEVVGSDPCMVHGTLHRPGDDATGLALPATMLVERVRISSPISASAERTKAVRRARGIAGGAARARTTRAGCRPPAIGSRAPWRRGARRA